MKELKNHFIKVRIKVDDKYVEEIVLVMQALPKHRYECLDFDRLENEMIMIEIHRREIVEILGCSDMDVVKALRQLQEEFCNLWQMDVPKKLPSVLF